NRPPVELLRTASFARPRFCVREATAMKDTDLNAKLPADLAFVLQFDASCGEARDAGDPACGRVEHVVSGRASRFRSFDELERFLAAVLRETAVKRGEVK